MLFEWQLRRIRIKEQKKLNRANLMLFKDISTYIKNSNLRGIEQEEILQQIIDMILQAQYTNKLVETVVGSDYQMFCEEVILEYSNSKTPIYKAVTFLQKYLVSMLLLIIIGIVVRIITEGTVSFEIKLNQLFIFSIIALFIIPLSKKNTRETLSLPFSLKIYNLSRGENNKRLQYIWIVFMLLVIVKGVYGNQVLNYSIDLYANMQYPIIVLLIILLIELFKKISDIVD